MYYDYCNQEFFTKNRKLVLKEYDDNGNLLEERVFGEKELAKFISIVRNDYDQLKVARYKHLKQFTEEELELIEKCIYHMALNSNYNSNYRVIGLDTDEDVEFYKELLKMPKEKLELAINLSTPHQGGFNVSMGSPYAHISSKMTLDDAIEFINNRTGIYYTVTNEGKRRWDFVDKPTLKQYKYQLQKNGERTVFLNFQDWKEYIVTEEDLK